MASRIFLSSLIYLVLETDSNDSLAKDEDSFSMSVPTLSLISDQMQKHLLSSTMLGSSRSGSIRPAGSGSPTDICTSLLRAHPTPSPSPFNNITDLSSLDGEVNLGSKLQPPSDHYEEPQPGGGKLSSSVLQQPVSNLQPISFSSNPPPPVSRLQQISFNPPPPPPVQTMSGQPDVKLLLVESSPSSIPNSLALLTPEPISIIQPSSGARFSATASSHSSISQVEYPSSSNTFNKKKRLLTFLTEQENNQIILAPTKSDQILFNSGKSDEILINSAKSETINATPAPTLFLQPCVNSMTAPSQSMETAKQEQAATLIINQGQRTKNEPTLIINPEGTAATLIAPVSGPASLPLLTPCISSNMLGPEARPAQQFSNSAPVTNYTSWVQSPNLDILPLQPQQFAPKPPSMGHNLQPIQPQQPQNYEQYCEKVTCFKCRLCGYLVLSQAALRHHILDDHEEVVDEEDSGKESDWISTALKHKIQICCSLCSNKFNSGRSFKVHMSEDHGLSDNETERELEKINKERKEKSIKVMKEEKIKAKEERKKKRQVSFEAYIDGNNELKIRMPKLSTDSSKKLPITKNITVENSEFEKTMKDSSKVMKPNQEVKEKNDIKNSFQQRKKISNNENKMYKCEFSECQIKCADYEQMRLHEKSHSGSGFLCPFSCSRKGRTTKTWSLMKLHLWREHKLDLGLLRCSVESCGFVTNNKAKYEKHQVKHVDTKPWLCPLCGKAFQLAKQLRAHASIHASSQTSTSHKSASDSKLTCQKCKASFSSPRQLRLHIDSVHHKKRNFLCSFCGYSASSRSALKLHIRKHTGDKPFTCDSCPYSSSDHNSLRRHKMRHSGLRPYNCPYCPYSSIQSTTYKVHLKNKHAIEDVSNILYQCKRCDFKTLKENFYLAHVVLHEEARTDLPG